MNEKILRTQIVSLLKGGEAHMTVAEAVADFPVERINDIPQRHVLFLASLGTHPQNTKRHSRFYDQFFICRT